jgi:hypothetical protein
MYPKFFRPLLGSFDGRGMCLDNSMLVGSTATTACVRRSSCGAFKPAHCNLLTCNYGQIFLIYFVGLFNFIRVAYLGGLSSFMVPALPSHADILALTTGYYRIQHQVYHWLAGLQVTPGHTWCVLAGTTPHTHCMWRVIVRWHAAVRPL